MYSPDPTGIITWGFYFAKSDDKCYNNNMISIRTRIRKYGKMVGLLCLSLVVGLNGSVSAILPKNVLDFYAQNGIYYYNQDDGCETNTPVLGKNVTWIGDSYSVGAEIDAGGNLISKKLAGVDLGNFNKATADQPADSYIKGGKFVNGGANSDNPGGIELLKSIVDSGDLRDYLVFALGANGGINASQVNEVLNLVNGKAKVVFVNLYMTTGSEGIQSYIASSNDVLKKAEAENSDKVKVADWASVAKDEYYAGDASGVHPFGGYAEWVDVIYDALGSFAGRNSTQTVGDNKNYAGDTVWSDEQLEAINAGRSVYEKAEKETGIPWQAIATMHSLETGLSHSNPAGGQGLYGLYTYTNGGTNANAFVPAGPVSNEEFERQTLIAAGEMAKIINATGLDMDSDEGIKALLFQYNGAASQYKQKALALGFSQEEANWGEGSPYVMNRYDARRDPNSSQMDPAWPGRFVADGVYDAGAVQYDFGGFVKYIALKGATGGSSLCQEVAGGNMDLNASAIALAWAQSERDNTYTKGKPEYLAAIMETWTSGYELSVATAGSFNRGDGSMIPVGMSCDNFVGTVVRFSGINPDFPVWLGNQKTYLASSDMWEQVEVNDSSQAKAGDIRIENNGGHILMIVEVDGELKVASASSGDRFGDIQDYYTKPGITYRLKT